MVNGGSSELISVPVPDSVVLALLLIPGYLMVRSFLYSARYTGPESWEEYEKVAVSLIGSFVVLAVIGPLIPTTIEFQLNQGSFILSTDVSGQEYGIYVLSAIVIGSIVGWVFQKIYSRVGGRAPIRANPVFDIVKKTGDTVPVRITTSEEEYVGFAEYFDENENLVVIRRPMRIIAEDNGEYRQPLGIRLYIDPEEITSISFGTDFKRSSLATTRPTLRNDNSGSSLVVNRQSIIRTDTSVKTTGLITNTSDETLPYSQVEILFKNKKGAMVGAIYRTFLDLQKDESREYTTEYETNEPSDIRSFSAEGSWQESTPKYHFVEKTIDRIDSKVIATGIIKCTHKNGFEYIQIKITFKDKYGARVGTKYDSTYNLREDDLWKFYVEYENKGPSQIYSIDVQPSFNEVV